MKILLKILLMKWKIHLRSCRCVGSQRKSVYFNVGTIWYLREKPWDCVNAFGSRTNKITILLSCTALIHFMIQIFFKLLCEHQRRVWSKYFSSCLANIKNGVDQIFFKLLREQYMAKTIGRCHLFWMPLIWWSVLVGGTRLSWVNGRGANLGPLENQESECQLDRNFCSSKCECIFCSLMRWITQANSIRNEIRELSCHSSDQKFVNSTFDRLYYIGTWVDKIDIQSTDCGLAENSGVLFGRRQRSRCPMASTLLVEQLLMTYLKDSVGMKWMHLWWQS